VRRSAQVPFRWVGLQKKREATKEGFYGRKRDNPTVDMEKTCCLKKTREKKNETIA